MLGGVGAHPVVPEVDWRDHLVQMSKTMVVRQLVLQVLASPTAHVIVLVHFGTVWPFIAQLVDEMARPEKHLGVCLLRVMEPRRVLILHS